MVCCSHATSHVFCIYRLPALSQLQQQDETGDHDQPCPDGAGCALNVSIYLPPAATAPTAPTPAPTDRYVLAATKHPRPAVSAQTAEPTIAPTIAPPVALTTVLKKRILRPGTVPDSVSHPYECISSAISEFSSNSHVWLVRYTFPASVYKVTVEFARSASELYTWRVKPVIWKKIVLPIASVKSRLFISAKKSLLKAEVTPSSVMCWGESAVRTGAPVPRLSIVPVTLSIIVSLLAVCTVS
mmetsp:Transcript_31979/g.38679  ORF Transcript_31979/g.38679 Transcript_31979/m.38679 type:complete len:242 (-) Transcript_31979:509-1234(-)